MSHAAKQHVIRQIADHSFFPSTIAQFRHLELMVNIWPQAVVGGHQIVIDPLLPPEKLRAQLQSRKPLGIWSELWEQHKTNSARSHKRPLSQSCQKHSHTQSMAECCALKLWVDTGLVPQSKETRDSRGPRRAYRGL